MQQQSALTGELEPRTLKTQILKIIRRDFYPLVLLISALQRLLWFQGSNVLAGGDLVPLLNPTSSLADLIYVWNDVNFGGLRVTAPRLFSPFGVSQAFGQISGLGFQTGEKILVILMYALAAISIYYLWPLIFRQTQWQRSAFAASIAYVYSPYLIADGIQTSVRFAVQYALVPLFLLLFARGISQGDMRYAILMGLFSPFIFSDFPGFQVAGYVALSCLLFSLFYMISTRKIRFSVLFIGIAGLSSVLVNTWWMLPVFTNLGSYSSALTVGPIDFAAQTYSTISQVFRFLGKWSFYSSFDGVNYIPYSNSYDGNPFSLSLSYAPTALAFGALILRPRNRSVLFCVWATIIGFFLTKGINPPFGSLYQFLLTAIPAFRVYRESFYLQQLAVIPASLLIGTSIGAIIARVNRAPETERADGETIGRPWGSYVVGTVCIALVIAASWPLVTGAVSINPFAPDSHGVKIPSSYTQLIQWINRDRQQGDFKVLVLPQRGLYAAYNWGYQGGNLLFSSLSDVILGGGTEYVASPDAQWAADLLYQSFYANSTAFAKLLSIMGVKYVLLESDFNTTFYQLPSIQRNEAILNSTGLVPQKQFDNLFLYRNPLFSSDIYLPQSLTQVKGTLDNPTGVVWDDNNFTEGWSVEKWDNEVTTYSSAQHELSLTLQSSGSYVAGSVIRKLPPLPSSARDLTIRFRTNDATAMSVEILENGTSYYPDSLNPSNGGPLSSVNNVTGAYQLNWKNGSPNAIRIWISNYLDANFVGPLSLSIDYIRISESIGSPEDVMSLIQNSTMRQPASFLLQEDVANAPSQVSSYLGNGTLISVAKHDPTSYDLMLQLSGPAVFVLSQTYSPAWSATISNQLVPTHFKIDGFANAWLINSSGTVDVHIGFDSQRYVVLGAAVSLASTVCLIAVLLLYRRSFRIWRKKSVQVENSETHEQQSALQDYSSPRIG